MYINLALVLIANVCAATVFSIVDKGRGCSTSVAGDPSIRQSGP